MRIGLVIPLAVVGLFASEAKQAFALGGSLNSPDIASSGTMRDRDTSERLKILSDKKFNFIVGWFVNETTHLNYGGDTASLNAFLSELAATHGTTIDVGFSKETKTAASPFDNGKGRSGACQWEVFHSSRKQTVFHVTIYLGDGKIDIAKLDLPPIGCATNDVRP